MRDETQQTERDEREFFASYYGEQRYHPVGWRLRMERDLRVLLAAAGGEGRGPTAGGEGRGPTAGSAGLGRTLSIGCGDGAFELLLAPHAESVVGVDLSPEAIAAAERARAAAGIGNAAFRCTSFRELPWDERFDTIVCLAFLHHVPEAELAEFLRACHAHLAPGGRFFSQDPNERGALRAIGRILLGGGYDRYHTPDERELDPAGLAADLRTAGFATVEIRHVDLTLIPACYLLARGPAWPLRLAALTDRAWCASPLARWSSGFAALAKKSESEPERGRC